MNFYFIVTQAFDHTNESAYLELRQTDSFEKHDMIVMTAPPHYVDPMGWYLPLSVGDHNFYMSASMLENYYKQGYITTMDDLLLARNYNLFKINWALDEKDKDQFDRHTTHLYELEKLIAKAEDAVGPEVPSF
ncbi:hypothetical protein MUO14_04875 [Halobacillus shinanisalinarum]|uniref:Uncharacterized protein n=1 Tax=Halobacillus shinanisalinarum TaxID=2932258 RepID=A0ABY4H1T4_9BACI|nr:hypothetical protein [Halobacillus shinanisalinarum]UOQ94299.1 hypothetical protein MUO14_04875 [Halobacillus shinanisalinarum]